MPKRRNPYLPPQEEENPVTIAGKLTNRKRKVVEELGNTHTRSHSTHTHFYPLTLTHIPLTLTCIPLTTAECKVCRHCRLLERDRKDLKRFKRHQALVEVSESVNESRCRLRLLQSGAGDGVRAQLRPCRGHANHWCGLKPSRGRNALYGPYFMKILKQRMVTKVKQTQIHITHHTNTLSCTRTGKTQLFDASIH